MITPTNGCVISFASTMGARGHCAIDTVGAVRRNESRVVSREGRVAPAGRMIGYSRDTMSGAAPQGVARSDAGLTRHGVGSAIQSEESPAQAIEIRTVPGTLLNRDVWSPRFRFLSHRRSG